jgi:hypothetical protein
MWTMRTCTEQTRIPTSILSSGMSRRRSSRQWSSWCRREFQNGFVSTRSATCRFSARHLPSAYAVRIGDDLAARSLPEHFGEANDWHDAAFDQVLKYRARPHGRKLVYVADQNQIFGSP